MTKADAVAWLPYIPRLVYRDIVGVDLHHDGVLRERDAEVFAANGRFCRRALPGEFTGEALSRMTHGAFVVVSFAAGRWRRQLGRTQATVIQKLHWGKR